MLSPFCRVSRTSLLADTEPMLISMLWTGWVDRNRQGDNDSSHKAYAAGLEKMCSSHAVSVSRHEDVCRRKPHTLVYKDAESGK